ncbi:MAG: NAD(P)H-hydrate epimerase, partial [Proteobacteria bacterium]|nr:NAD(P)H-hydrate epimerase [Pseudomonadota bacterium]
MNYIFNISQIRDIENHLFTNHIQPYELMKRAGDEAFNIIKHQYPHSTDLTIFCGKGNNAGDAYIIAMKALSEGYCVTIIELYEQLSQLATQARNELKALQKCPDLKFIKYNSNNKITIDEQSIIIDAIFGIGFKGKIKEPEESAFHLINNSANKVVAIDIASGLDADTGKVESIAVKADITISFIAAKFGLFLEDGKDHIGELHIANLGTPKEVFDRFNNHHQLLNFDYLKQFIPQRKSSDHKGSHGHALLIGGLEDMPGAIIMSAKSCYRMGVGKVTIITQRKNYAIIAASLPEAMFQDIDEIVKDSCNFAEFTQQFSIITIGPGLSQSAI